MIPLFCPLTPARVVVEVVAGVAHLDGSARANAELRVPELRLIVPPALLRLVDIVAYALAVVRLVMMLVAAVL